MRPCTECDPPCTPFEVARLEWRDDLGRACSRVVALSDVPIELTRLPRSARVSVLGWKPMEDFAR